MQFVIADLFLSSLIKRISNRYFIAMVNGWYNLNLFLTLLSTDEHCLILKRDIQKLFKLF